MITFRYLLLDQLINVDKLSSNPSSCSRLPGFLDFVLFLGQMFIKIKKSVAHNVVHTTNFPTFLLRDNIRVMHYNFLVREAPNECMVVRHFQTQTLT